jgi:hypothetical protein
VHLQYTAEVHAHEVLDQLLARVPVRYLVRSGSGSASRRTPRTRGPPTARGCCRSREERDLGHFCGFLSTADGLRGWWGRIDGWLDVPVDGWMVEDINGMSMGCGMGSYQEARGLRSQASLSSRSWVDGHHARSPQGPLQPASVRFGICRTKNMSHSRKYDCFPWIFPHSQVGVRDWANRNGRRMPHPLQGDRCRSFAQGGESNMREQYTMSRYNNALTLHPSIVAAVIFLSRL